MTIFANAVAGHSDSKQKGAIKAEDVRLRSQNARPRTREMNRRSRENTARNKVGPGWPASAFAYFGRGNPKTQRRALLERLGGDKVPR